MIKTHNIGYCAKCGWVNAIIRRVSVEEGEKAVIKALCINCINKRQHEVICDYCGRTRGENLYPVSIMRKIITKTMACQLFVHLCAECRSIPHAKLLTKFQLPDNICDSCKDRFVCFSNKHSSPLPSMSDKAIVDGKRMLVSKNWISTRLKTLTPFQKNRAVLPHRRENF